MISNSNHIQSLIQLIDDPDDIVYDQVRHELLKCGSLAIPYLEQSWEHDIYGLAFQNRVESILHDIQFNISKEELEKWVKSSEKDLLQGALIIAKSQYPGLNEVKIKQYIENLKKDIWLELNDDLTAFEKVKVFNNVFFELHSFHGDNRNYYSPVNSYINTVLESKKGNPLSLGILYSYVAQMLDLPIYGVNLPNHFILAFLDSNHTNAFLKDGNQFGVLFYINVFSKGSILNDKEISNFLEEINVEIKREYFEPCSNTSIIHRMLVNLIQSFKQIGNENRISELEQLRKVLNCPS